MSTGDEVRRSQALAAQLPMVTGLLSACLSSGATLGKSLAVVARSVPEPSASLLHDAARTSSLGGGSHEVVAVLSSAGDPGWQSLADAITRSAVTGAPLAELLGRLAEQGMTQWSMEASVRARGTAVRSVLPLALCFLPAFLLLGVAPVVAGFLSRLTFP
jgi:Flp pilus assembly protein TadB